MAGFEQANNNGTMRAIGEWIGAFGLGIITAVDIAVIYRSINNETVNALMPVAEVGVGAVAVGVALMIVDSPETE